MINSAWLLKRNSRKSVIELRKILQNYYFGLATHFTDIWTFNDTYVPNYQLQHYEPQASRQVLPTL